MGGKRLRLCTSFLFHNNHKSFRLQQYIYIVWRFHGVQEQLPSLTGLLRISYDCNQGLFDAKVQIHAHVTMLT